MPRKKTSTERADEFIRSNFGKVWPVFVHRYTEYTINCRRTFDGDLELMLVLAVIGDATLNTKNTPPDLTHSQLMSGPHDHIMPEDINASSIAEYSGIPRETVRRKIAVLEGKGWVSKNREGMLVVTGKAAKDLAPMTEIGIRYMNSMASLFEQLSTDAQKPK